MLEITRLPEDVLLLIFLYLDTAAKLRVAYVCKKFHAVIFTPTRNVLWKELKIAATTGHRTLPLLRKLAPCIGSMELRVTSVGIFADLPIFENLEALKFTGDTEHCSERVLSLLASRFPVLKCLKVEENFNTSDITTICTALPTLKEIVLDGKLVVNASATTTHSLRGIIQNLLLTVKKVKLSSGSNCELLNCLAASKIAPTVQELSITVENATNPQTSLEPFATLKNLALKVNFGYSVCPAWLAGIRRVRELETLKLQGLSAQAHAQFWNDAQCLPENLSTIHLSDVLPCTTGPEVLECLNQRLGSLKNIVLTGLHDISFGLARAVVNLVSPDSRVEYLHIQGSCREDEACLNNTMTYDEIKDYFMIVGPILSAVRFVYLDVDLLSFYADIDDFGFNDIRPQDRLPADPCIVQIGERRSGFTETEAAFIVSLDGWKLTKRPSLE